MKEITGKTLCTLNRNLHSAWVMKFIPGSAMSHVLLISCKFQQSHFNLRTSVERKASFKVELTSTTREHNITNCSSSQCSAGQKGLAVVIEWLYFEWIEPLLYIRVQNEVERLNIFLHMSVLLKMFIAQLNNDAVILWIIFLRLKQTNGYRWVLHLQA